MTADVHESEVANGGERDVSPSHDLAISNGDANADANENNANDDVDDSYVIVSGTDAKGKDLVDSDLNVEPPCSSIENNGGLELRVAADPKTENENETVVIGQPPHMAQINDGGEVEDGGEEIHEIHESVISSDLAADEKENQESEIGVNDVQNATKEDKEEADSIVNEIPPEQDFTPEIKFDVAVSKVSISNESCDDASESVVVDEKPAEQNGDSETVESLPSPVICENASPSPAEIGPSSPTALDYEQPSLSFSEEVPVQGSQGEDGAVLDRSLETPLCSEVDKTIQIQVSHGPLSEKDEEGLLAGLTPGSLSEAVDITDLVDATQNTPEQNESSENAESLTSPSICCDALESGESFPDAPINKISENSDAENEVSLPAVDLPTREVEDVRPETDAGKSNQINIENPESCPVENEKIPVDPESDSPSNDVRFEPETSGASNGIEESISTDARDVESKISDRTPECAGSQTNVESVSHINTSVDPDSSSPASLVAADVKPESEVENTSAVPVRDMPSDEVIASEGKDSGSAVDSNIDSAHVGNDVKSTSQEVASIDENQKDEASTSIPEDSSEGQNVGAEVVTRPFYFLIRIPRYDDENLREQIKLAQLQVEERTKSRDAIRAQIQMKRATLKEYADKVQACLTEDRAARDSVKSKRQEMDSVQFVINKVKNAMSVEDIDGRIRNMEHMIQHETLPLREEKQLIREIKQLKQHREQLSSSMGKQDEIQQALDQKDQIEERLKVLRKELDLLRDNLTKTEEATKSAKKRFNDENDKLNEIISQFRAADGIRQEAYAHLQSLRKQQYEKNKHFWRYKDDAKAAQNLSLSGDKEQLQRLCLDQVERISELWNRNDDFRREYIKSNTRSTLRRLRTLDGRALGPDEEPPIIPDIVNYRVTKDNSLKLTSVPEEVKQDVPVKADKPDDKQVVAKVVEKKNQTAKNKTAKPASSATISGEEETKEREEEAQRSKEEEELARKAEELARKAEELRKQEEAAKLKHQLKLEEKAKAKEALDRKKRKAERDQARAAIRAQKEAEEKEKERERRAKKKERKKANRRDVRNEDEGEPAPTPSSEIPASGAPNEAEADAQAEAEAEAETREKATTTVKRPQKGSQFVKQSKTKLPPHLRNRGKKRMQPWMWVVLTVVVVLALFLVANSGFSYKDCLRWFGF